MKVALVFFNDYEPEETAEALLARLFTVGDWARALGGAGMRASVFLRFFCDEHREAEGADFHFCKSDGPIRSRLPWEYARRVSHWLREDPPDLVHAHNLNEVLGNGLLRLLLPAGLPMLIQDHGSRADYRFPRLQRFLFRRIDGFLFAAPGQERPWLEGGLILSADRCHFVMENASPFRRRSRLEARRRTGLTGDPVFLWVGHLDRNKDPLTVLEGFSSLAGLLPEARLYLIYRSGALLAQVRTKVAGDPVLAKAVTLLGKKNREELEAYYNSADYFLAGSHKEGSGYALLEAMSCGVIPIVTDIPSFRRLTGRGEVGGLWEAGRAESLASVLREVTARPVEAESMRVRRRFAKHFTFSAMAREAGAVYRRVIQG